MLEAPRRRGDPQGGFQAIRANGNPKTRWFPCENPDSPECVEVARDLATRWAQGETIPSGSRSKGKGGRYKAVHEEGKGPSAPECREDDTPVKSVASATSVEVTPPKPVAKGKGVLDMLLGASHHE